VLEVTIDLVVAAVVVVVAVEGVVHCSAQADL